MIKSKRLYWFCFILIIFIVGVLIGCSNGVNNTQLSLYDVQGTTKDINDNIINDVEVEIGSKNTLSKSDGSWQIEELNPGDYTIKASKIGYQNFSEDISLNSDITYHIVLLEESSENQPPELSSIGNKNIDENDTLVFIVTAIDLDGDSINLSVSDLPAGASFNSETGEFNWTPTNEQSGYYDITFTASDGSLADSETITITVGDLNRPPIISSIGNKNAYENSTLNFSVTAEDPDGDSVTISVSGLPDGAEFNSNTGEFSWKPTFDQSGSYNLTFTASDGDLEDNEVITINVENFNRPPVIETIEDQFIVETKTLTFTVSASDPDGQTVNLSMSEVEGANFNSTTGKFSWSPKNGTAGDYYIIFTASDGKLDTSETVYIEVVDNTKTNLAYYSAIQGKEALLESDYKKFRVYADSNFLFKNLNDDTCNLEEFIGYLEDGLLVIYDMTIYEGATLINKLTYKFDGRLRLKENQTTNYFDIDIYLKSNNDDWFISKLELMSQTTK